VVEQPLPVVEQPLPVVEQPLPVVELVETMARLRRECPWKAEQTHRSLSRYLLEEAHETLEAIDAGERTGSWDHLREELGDLLLQVYFHAAIAAESGIFDIEDVAADLIAKLHRRNPHVFGDANGRTMAPHEVNEEWQRIKAAEKQRAGVTDGLPPTLPALLHADKVVDRLERSGTPVVTTDDDLGSRLLALVVEAHNAGVDPEQALRDAVRGLAPTAD
jgi:XTP/dITP diphosphohydrolase